MPNKFLNGINLLTDFLVTQEGFDDITGNPDGLSQLAIYFYANQFNVTYKADGDFGVGPYSQTVNFQDPNRSSNLYPNNRGYFSGGYGIYISNAEDTDFLFELDISFAQINVNQKQLYKLLIEFQIWNTEKMLAVASRVNNYADQGFVPAQEIDENNTPLFDENGNPIGKTVNLLGIRNIPLYVNSIYGITDATMEIDDSAENSYFGSQDFI